MPDDVRERFLGDAVGDGFDIAIQPRYAQLARTRASSPRLRPPDDERPERRPQAELVECGRAKVAMIACRAAMSAPVVGPLRRGRSAPARARPRSSRQRDLERCEALKRLVVELARPTAALGPQRQRSSRAVAVPPPSARSLPRWPAPAQVVRIVATIGAQRAFSIAVPAFGDQPLEAVAICAIGAGHETLRDTELEPSRPSFGDEQNRSQAVA